MRPAADRSGFGLYAGIPLGRVRKCEMPLRTLSPCQNEPWVCSSQVRTSVWEKNGGMTSGGRWQQWLTRGVDSGDSGSNVPMTDARALGRWAEGCAAVEEEHGKQKEGTRKDGERTSVAGPADRARRSHDRVLCKCAIWNR